MIYDTNSMQYQQFLRSSGRRRDDYGKTKSAIVNKQTSKPAGAASTGLYTTGMIKDPAQCAIASQVTSVVLQGAIVFSILGTIGVDTSPLIAAAGVTGATIGFACKDFGSNFVAGVALAGQPSLCHGSKITLGTGTAAVSGTVINWDTRYIYLLNDKNYVIHVPNNVILNSIVLWENPTEAAAAGPPTAGAAAGRDKEWKAFAGKAEPINKSDKK